MWVFILYRLKIMNVKWRQRRQNILKAFYTFFNTVLINDYFYIYNTFHIFLHNFKQYFK
jgi:hypothetical protein